MQPSKRAQEIIEKVIYASLATVDQDGKPWNAPVFVAHDEDYTFFWGSASESQHSQNIQNNGKGFLVLYDSTVEPGRGEGVYIEADCAELTEEAEIRTAHALLWDRHQVPYWKLEQFLEKTPVRLYKGVPKRLWMNGEGERDGHYIDIRVIADA